MKEIIEILENSNKFITTLMNLSKKTTDENCLETLTDIKLTAVSIQLLLASALDKLKAQEEADRHVVQVEIPELDDNGSCNAKCPIIDNCDWNDWINCDWFPVNFNCPHYQKEMWDIDRSHEECADCSLSELDPPQCKGHAAGPIPCSLYQK
jgi:hypothetical protein